MRSWCGRLRFFAIVSTSAATIAVALGAATAEAATPKPLGNGPITVTIEGRTELSAPPGKVIGTSTFTAKGTMRGKRRVLGTANGEAEGSATWPDGPCTINPRMTYELSGDRQGANLVLVIEPRARGIVGTGVQQCQSTMTAATAALLPTVTVPARNGATATATGTAGGGNTRQSVTVTVEAK